MSKVTIRPHTQSVFDKLKQSSLAKDTSSRPNKASSMMLASINQISINAKNVRNTFTSLEALSKFISQIGWPDDALDGGLEEPLQWIEELDAVSDEDKQAFQKIIQRALSIQSVGQLQPVGAIKNGDRYDIVYGSTRAMACYLLKKDIALNVLQGIDSLSVLKAHLFENIERDDLSFTEIAKGYLQLFELLLDNGEIEQVSRSVVMQQLNLSRTHAQRWNSIIKQALSDNSFREHLLGGMFSGFREAIAYIEALTKPSEDLDPQPSVVPDFTADSGDEDSVDVETEDAVAESISLPETSTATNDSQQAITETPSPRVQLSSEASHSNTMIVIVTAAFEGLVNQADHPASSLIKSHIEEFFPINDVTAAQRSIDWLASAMSETLNS